jgi:L-threonylcarbamoyladenylate synthase
VRMPDHEVALDLLARTGPLAVSSANRSGLPAATDADGAADMLGERVEVLLDAGSTPGDVPSTIVDVTGDVGRVLRLGAVSLERLNEIASPIGVEIVDEG